MMQGADDALQVIYDAFASAPGAIEPDDIVKFCTQCELIDEKCTEADVKMCYTRVKVGKKTGLSFDRFKECVRQIATHTSVTYQELCLVAKGNFDAAAAEVRKPSTIMNFSMSLDESSGTSGGAMGALPAAAANQTPPVNKHRHYSLVAKQTSNAERLKTHASYGASDGDKAGHSAFETDHMKTGGLKLNMRPEAHGDGTGKVELDAECLEVFEKLKIRRKHRYITFKISETGEKIVVDKIGAPAEGSDDFFKILPDTEPRYCVFDREFKTADGRPVNKLWFIVWNPQNSTDFMKIQYTYNKRHLRDKLKGVFDLSCRTIKDLEEGMGMKEVVASDDDDSDFEFED
jgi:cofilin